MLTDFFKRTFQAVLPSLFLICTVVPTQVLATETSFRFSEESNDPNYKILPTNKLAKNGAKSLGVRYDMTDFYARKFVLEGLDGKKVLWSKEVANPDESGRVQNIDVDAVGTNKIKVTIYDNYNPVFFNLGWDGTNLKLLSTKVDDTEKKNIKALYDALGSGKLESQSYYSNVGENFSVVWLWTDRKEIAAMIKRADATATKDYHAGRLDKAIAREAAALSTAADLLERILGGTEHIQVEDSGSHDGDSAYPLHWLKVFQKAHIKPNTWGDDRTYFPPSSYLNAVNNYAFFLQLKGEHAKAIPIFQKVIAIDPERAVNYLNLGDSLFATGSKKEAVAAYRNYEKHLDKHTIIPERVIQRLNGNL